MADPNQDRNQDQSPVSPGLEDLELRTMESDKESIKDQGGGAPKPYKPPENLPTAGMASKLPSNQPNQSQPKAGEPLAAQTGSSFGVQSAPGVSAPVPAGDLSPSGAKPPTPPKKQDFGSSEPPQNVPPADLAGAEEFPPKQKSGSKLFVILLVVIVVVGLATAAYFLFFAGEDGEGSEQVTTPPAEQQEGAIASQEEINCGSDLNCLTEAAKTCSGAQANLDITMPFLGLNDTKNITYKLEKASGDLCSLYQQINSSKVSLSSEARQEALSQGLSEAEIMAQEEAATESQIILNGKESVCIFTKNSLITMFQNLESGDYSFSSNISLDSSKSSDELSQEQARSYAESVGAESCSGSLFNLSDYQPAEEVVTEEESQPEIIEPPVSASEVVQHVSLLSTSADSTLEQQLNPISLANLKSVADFSPTEVPLFRELVLQDSENNFLSLSAVFSILAPTVFSSETAGLFEPDFSLFTYSDDNGTWLGALAQLDGEADRSAAVSAVSKFETNVNEVKNFFLTNPGAETTWKDGGSDGVDSRYLTFGANGASFNYGWSGDFLLITTSYSSFQEAVSRL